MMDKNNEQNISKSTGGHTNIGGGTRIGQFDFEKRIFELEEQLEHMKEENKLLKNELHQMRQINLQLRRETNESFSDRRFIDLTDLCSCRESTQNIGQKNIHLQQLEERLMGLEKRMDIVEKNGSNDPRIFQKLVEHPMNEYFVVENGQQKRGIRDDKAKLQEAKSIKSTLEATMLQAEFLKPSFSDFKDCMIHFDVNDKKLILFGPESVLRDCQMKLMLEMKKIKEETITISSDMKSILSREKGKQYLESLNSSGLNGAKVAIDDFTILLAAKEDNILSNAVKILKCKLDFVESVKSEVVVPNDRLISLKYCIEHSLLVHVTFDASGKIITLLGIKDDVLMARRDVEKLFEEFGVYEKSFNVGGPEAMFLHFCCEDRINSCLKSVDVIELTLTETKVFIRYKGSKGATSQAQRNLQDLKNSIWSKTWNLLDDFKKHELFLLSNSLKSGPMKQKLETYKYREKILVIPYYYVLGSRPHNSLELHSNPMANSISEV